MMLLLLLSCCIYLGDVTANNYGNCSINKIKDGNWQTQLQLDINDNDINKIIFKSKYTGSIKDIKCEKLKEFFAVEKTDENFVIKTTSEMKSFDDKTKKTTRLFTTELLQCNIKCDSALPASKLKIFLKITDINTHPPEFSQQEYTFHVPSPLMPLTDFSIYESRIVVTDLDFSNQDVTFTIEPQDFKIKTISSTEDKKYTATFATIKPIQIFKDKIYKLTATDSGKNPHSLSTTVTVTLKSNPSSSIDIPSFEKNSYEFIYSNEGGKPKLTPRGGAIIVKTNKPEELSNESFGIEGDLSIYLTPSFDSSSQTISLDVKEISTTSNFLLSTLTVKTDQSGSATIIVYMPSKNDELIFNNHLYYAYYNKDKKTITVDPIITVKSGSEIPKIVISGAHSDYFQINYDDKTKSFDFSLSKGHTIEQLGNIIYSKQLLTATLGKNVDHAQLLLKVPKQELKFTKLLYTATYNADQNSIDFDEDNLIQFTKEVDEVELNIDKTYAKYFTISHKSGEHTCDLKISNQLPEDMLEAGKDLVITITVKDKIGNQDQTNVKIIMPSMKSILEFANAYYEVEYPAIGSGDIDLPIKFKTTRDLSKVSIRLESYTENFDIHYTSEKWQLRIKKPLNTTITKKYTELPIVMCASLGTNGKKSIAILLIKLPRITKSNFEFSKAYYTGMYPEKNNNRLELSSEISFTVNTNVNNIKVIVENYEENFEINFIDDKWSVNLKNRLDEKVIKNNNILITKLVAIKDGSKDNATAIFIIQFPVNKIPTDSDYPKFSHLYYQGKLYYWNNQSLIELDHVNITNRKDLTKIKMSIDSTYEKYFKVSYIAEQNRWNLNSLTNLPSDKLKDKVVVLILTASETNKTGIGQTVLILSIYDQTSSIEFKDENYMTTYPKKGEGEMMINPKIQLKNVKDINKVKISVIEFENNFQLSYDPLKNWHLNIKEPLDKTILDNYTGIITALNATEEGSYKKASAALYLKLPAEVAPIFSNILYNGNYTIEDGKAIVYSEEIKIINKDDLSKITLTLNSTYIDYFSILFDRYKKSWSIKPLEPLPKNLLMDLAVYLTLTATEEGNTHKGSSVVILKFPWENDFAPTFSKAYFSGKYVIKDGKPNVILDEIVIPNKEPTKIHLSIDSQYEKYFTIVYNVPNKSWMLKTIDLLPNNLLTKKELILPLTATENNNKNQAFATVILSLPTNDAIKFSSIYYEVSYNIFHDEPNIIMKDMIKIETTENIKVYLISDTIDVDTYFEIKKQKSEQYILHVKKILPDVILEQPSLVLTIIAEMSYANSTATLVVNLPAKVKTRAIEFKQVLYSGELDDGKLSVDNIEIVTEEEDFKVWTTIEESEYSKYFQVKYENKKLMVSLNETAPEVELKTIPSTLLTVAVGISDTKDKTSAVLSLKSSINDNILNNTDDHKGAYIATISTLAVALVVVIIGTGIFYKIKIRDQSLRSNIDTEEVGHVRFDKNSQRKSSEPSERKPSDVSQRRPTGFIFNPLGEEIVEELDDSGEAEATERRKSVAFDENVQELQIETANEEEGYKSDVEDRDKETLQHVPEIRVDDRKISI